MHWTCRIGLHGERETVKRIQVNGFYKPVFGAALTNIPMELRFSRCKECKTVFAHLDYGSGSEEVDLMMVAALLRAERYEEAMRKANSLDTIVRDQIPQQAWDFLQSFA